MNLPSLRPRYRHPDTSLYNFHLGAVISPGTGNLAFEPAFQLPAFRVAQGVQVRGSLAPHQPPQVYQTRVIGIQGVGGLIAGQVAHQSLFVDGE